MEERRRCTTVRQLELLVEFLEGHKDLALGRVRSKEARALAARLWRECAELLNVAGPARSAKEWPKVWNDLKCRVRAKLVSINNNRQATGGGPSGAATLTSLEDRVARILGQDVRRLNGVRQNPFAIPNDDDKVNEVVEVANPTETQNISPEIILQEVRQEAASPAPSLTGNAPSPSMTRRIIRGQRRTKCASHHLAARALAQSNRIALEECREMMLKVETLRAEAALKNAEAALKNSEALNAFAEGFRLIAGSIDRFSQMFCQQRGQD